MSVCGSDNEKKTKSSKIIKNNDNTNEIKKMISSISIDCEYDKTKGLQINGLENFVNSIFPSDFPPKEIKEIKEHLSILNNKNNKKFHLYIFKNISKYKCYYLVLYAKKDSQKTIDISYKFKIKNIESYFDFNIIDSSENKETRIDIGDMSQEKENEIYNLVKEDINNLKETAFN